MKIPNLLTPMKSVTLLFIPLLLLSSCSIGWNDEKEQFITTKKLIQPEYLSCYKNSDCKVVSVNYCCVNEFTATNISYTGEVIGPLDCRNIDCVPPEYQSKIEDYKSICEENICKIQIK